MAQQKEGFFQYLASEIFENFIGFIVGMGVTKFISNFFETRSIRNLYGLTAKKKVVSKSEFENMEMVISIIIGFIALLLVRRLMMLYVMPYVPMLRFRAKRKLVFCKGYFRNIR
ncbi:MAG: hypothetical protein ACK4ND_12490 [Cytophagaceae bacterium]